MALPKFSIQQAKHHLSADSWGQFSSQLLEQIQIACHTPLAQFDIVTTQKFLTSYLRDAAKDILLGIGNGALSHSAPPTADRALTEGLLDLAEKLASVPLTLSIEALLDLAIVCGTHRHSSARCQKIYEIAFNTSPSLLKDFFLNVPLGFITALTPKDSNITAIHRTTYCLISLIRCAHDTIVLKLAQDKDFVVGLAGCYDEGLRSIADSKGGIQMTSSDPLRWEIEWMKAKVLILDSFSIMMDTLLRSTKKETKDSLIDIISTLLSLSAASTSSRPSRPIPFVNQSLLSDYEYSHHLSGSLRDALRGSNDPRLKPIIAGLESLAPQGVREKDPGGLALLLGIPPTQFNSHIDYKKGKEKALQLDEPPSEQLDLAVTQVLDIFPDEDVTFVQKCLRDSTFHGSAESLISALLEGNLPPDLQSLRDGLAHGAGIPASPPPAVSLLESRKNAFDDDPLDFSRLTRGKRPENPSAIVQDKSYLAELKANILRRVEEQQLSEEEEEKERANALEEDLDDAFPALPTVKVSNDGEESDDSDPDDHEGEAEAPKQSVDTILELAYIKDPKIFDRDAATRRSKTRADLKAQTSWSDEQLEGWRIMLDRNPKKDKILQKHEFSGNRPLETPESGRPESRGAGPSHASRGRGGHGRGGGGGGGGGGRGRGRGGNQGGGSGAEGGEGGSSAHDRAWKDKNKARNANHNRKRGHEKKMARGGGGAPFE
ncbi:hypothetical protein BOTBODRAFT_33626 [Botryobasidium botryosum FD-172 SS1]|uniref:CUE domain-containing protein n=1 Tax=Botryobasidium botryosum (strain FD-172 SS1) TaxID=930990 RepID=A0A067MC22_BOTB1|nr:hypothetical protein BOTBODRAFT_33626 [Botryobasidium botryosum FD-172 SS1]